MVQRATYLDWNATAPLRPEVIAAMAEALARTGNPSSVHRFGRDAKRALEQARVQVAALVGAAPADVIFTSGGTEANRLALFGLMGQRLIVSAVEHDSVRAAATGAEIIPVDQNGVIDLAALEKMLSSDPRPALVSVMLANNETGVTQPIAEAAALAHRFGALLHTDAVQAAGKIELNQKELGSDLITISAHKIGGPMGVGALIASPDLPLSAMQTGGSQERGRRAGTENLPGIVGFGGAAAVVSVTGYADLTVLRDRAEYELCALAPDARSYGSAVPRLPNTLAISMPGVAAATQVMALDLAGVMVSAGSACSSGKVRRSHVLDAMGVPPGEAECAIRISLGWSTTPADIDHLVEAWAALYTRTRASAA